MERVALKADAVILAGSVGLESAWTGETPRCLLPLVDTTLIERLLGKLYSSGCSSRIVCANGQTESIVRRLRSRGIDESGLKFCADLVPLGTAGCVKACQSQLSAESVLVIGGAVWLDDDPQWMLEKHLESGNAITVFCTRVLDKTGDGHHRFLPAGVFILDPSVLRFVPDYGYFDIKEQLIPRVQNAGFKVGAIVLQNQSQEIVNWSTYSQALEKTIDRLDESQPEVREFAPGIFCGKNVRIAPTARIVGPCVLGDGCVIGDNALVMGPTVLAEGTHVGASSCLVRVVTRAGIRIPQGMAVSDRFMGPSDSPITDNERPINAVVSPTKRPQTGLALLGKGTIALAFFVWAFWHTISDLFQHYQRDAESSVGMLAPLATAYMIWTRRAQFMEHVSSSILAGVSVFVAGFGVNLVGTHFLYASLSNLGLVLCANGIALAFLGYRSYCKIWYPLAFLILMCPMPGRIQDAVMLPLQTMASTCSSIVLETLGIAAERSGNVFEIRGHSVAVAEACNGLRMVTSSLLVAGVLAYLLIDRPRWQRVGLLISSIPIALACNIGRIVLTGILFHLGWPQLAEGLFHALTGLLMMPIMIGLLMVELCIICRVTRWASQSETAGPISKCFGNSTVCGV